MSFWIVTLMLLLSGPLVGITEMGANTRLGLFFPNLFGTEKKEAILSKLGSLSSIGQTRDLELKNMVSAAAGNHVRVQKLEMSQVIGASVRGPEVGVILSEVSKGKLKRVTVFHFTPSDHAEKTLEKLGPFQKGSRIAVFGGDGSNDSNALLQSIQAFLEKNSHLTNDGYADILNLWFTSKGTYLSSSNEPLS